MNQWQISRRNLLRGGLAAGAVAATAGLGLAGCSSGSSRTSSAQNAQNFKVKLPSYVPYTGAKPDLPASADGVLAGFFSYPPNPPSIVPQPPTSHPTTVLCHTNAQLPPALDHNSFWQELNRRLGAPISFTMVPMADYKNKLATTLASGDLPDLVQVRPGDIPRAPQAFQAEFQDLTPYLSGDAVAECPGLANIPPAAWISSVFNGGIYGVPIPLPEATNLLFTREDLLPSGVDLDTAVSNCDDFLALCREVTAPKQNRYAIGNVRGAFLFMREMLGVPNYWRQEGGKFVSSYDAPETEQALDVVAKMWKEGLFHPDTIAATVARPGVGALWQGTGVVVFDSGNPATWISYYAKFASTAKNFKIGGLVPPKFNGGGPARKYLGSGMYSITAFKKASPDRIKELLRLVNWMASPFGTAEYLFREYGSEGSGYTRTPTNDLTRTDTGFNETRLPTVYVGGAAPVAYIPGVPDATRTYHTYLQKVMPNGEHNATLGLFSETDDANNAQLEAKMTDAMNQIVQGRQPVSSWKDAVDNWRKSGGDKIRAEYEAAYAARQG